MVPRRAIRITLDLVAARQIDRVVAGPATQRMEPAHTSRNRVVAAIPGYCCVCKSICGNRVAVIAAAGRDRTAAERNRVESRIATHRPLLAGEADRVVTSIAADMQQAAAGIYLIIAVATDDRRTSPGTGNRVGIAAAIERIRAAGIVDRIGTKPAGHAVIAARRRDAVRTIRANDRIIADAAVEHGADRTRAGIEQIVAIAAEQRVMPGATDQRVVATLAEQHIVARAAVQAVIARAAMDGVVAVIAEDGVVENGAAEIMAAGIVIDELRRGGRQNALGKVRTHQRPDSDVLQHQDRHRGRAGGVHVELDQHIGPIGHHRDVAIGERIMTGDEAVIIRRARRKRRRQRRQQRGEVDHVAADATLEVGNRVGRRYDTVVAAIRQTLEEIGVLPGPTGEHVATVAPVGNVPEHVVA